jgi:hypothetical protein
MLRRLITLLPTVTFACLVLSIPAWADFVVIPQPTDFNYVSLTTPIDISALDELTEYSSISGDGLMVKFDNPMVRLTIPTTWASWGSPPATELNDSGCPGLGINCPPVLWSNGNSEVTMILDPTVDVFGFEAEPNSPTAEPITATFYDAKGKDEGSISLMPSGYSGALLFAATSDDPFEKVVLTSSDDFAIANVSFNSTPIVPEPRLGLLLGIGLVSLVIARRVSQGGSFSRHKTRRSQ